jgi:TPP-dependent pyruvate/acetoin dehydrogenase alpha subunit
MVLTREFDDLLARLYRLGKIPGASYGSRGQEATSVGSTLALNDDDIIGPMIRNVGSIIARDYPLEKILASFLGRATGPTGGRDGNTHFGDLEYGLIGPISMLGALIPVCAGAGLAFKMRGENRVALTYIGDGGSSVGDFHEGLNFAAVHDIPLIVILENNGWAYSTPVTKQTRVSSFADKAAGYGIPGVKVDGNDVVAVHETVRGAVERARRGEGPTLIEAVTMRMKGHAEHDDFSYVPKEELEEWEKKDPIAIHEKKLLDWGILTAEAAQEIRRGAKERVAEAEKKGLEAPWPESSTVGQSVYAEEVPEGTV